MLPHWEAAAGGAMHNSLPRTLLRAELRCPNHHHLGFAEIRQETSTFLPVKGIYDIYKSITIPILLPDIIDIHRYIDTNDICGCMFLIHVSGGRSGDGFVSVGQFWRATWLRFRKGRPTRDDQFFGGWFVNWKMSIGCFSDFFLNSFWDVKTFVNSANSQEKQGCNDTCFVAELLSIPPILEPNPAHLLKNNRQ